MAGPKRPKTSPVQMCGAHWDYMHRRIAEQGYNYLNAKDAAEASKKLIFFQAGVKDSLEPPLVTNIILIRYAEKMIHAKFTGCPACRLGQKIKGKTPEQFIREAVMEMVELCKESNLEPKFWTY